jgi:hypothetical protein
MDITLPPVASFSGPVTVAIDSGVVQVVTADSSTINGVAGATGITISAATPITVLYSNGTDWVTLAGGPTAVVDYEVVAVATGVAVFQAVAGTFIVDTPNSAGTTINLPLLAAGGPVTVKNITGTYVCTVKTTDSSTIDGVAGATGYALPAKYDTATFVTDGAHWYVLNSQLDTPI